MTTCPESTDAAEFERLTTFVKNSQKEDLRRTLFFSFLSSPEIRNTKGNQSSPFSSRLLYMIYTFTTIFLSRVTKEKKRNQSSSSRAAALRAFALSPSTCNSRFRIFAFASRSSALSRSLSSCKAEEAAEALPSYKQKVRLIQSII